MQYNFLLKNFKAISKMQKIPIRPLTLIFGPNSSGKSSIIHSILLINEAVKNGKLDINKTETGGDSVDIGGFRQYVFGRDSSKKVHWGIEIKVNDLDKRIRMNFEGVSKITYQITFGYINNDQSIEKEPTTMEFLIKGDDENIIKMTRDNGGVLRLSNLEVNNPVVIRLISTIIESYTTVYDVTDNDIALISKDVYKTISNLSIEEGTLFPTGIKLKKLIDIEDIVFPISKGNRLEDLLNVINLIFPWNIHEILNDLYSFINTEIKKVQYLGPLRSYPPRHFTLVNQEEGALDDNGGYSWHLLMKSSKVRESVNNWLSANDRLQTPYELKVRYLYESQKIGRYLLDRFNNIKTKEIDKIETIIKEIEAITNTEDNIGIESMRELILIDKRTDTPVSHRDVGIGISQTLPVLVSAFASVSKTIAIEQPELHLHPGLQSELGDVFINAALGDNKNTFILETHSEHLILRIMRRIRETYKSNLPVNIAPIKPDDVSILYVEPLGEEGSVIRFLELDEEGEFLDPWPGGFFEEGYNERFS